HGEAERPSACRQRKLPHLQRGDAARTREPVKMRLTVVFSMSTHTLRRGVGSIAICVLVLAGAGVRAQQDPRVALDAQIGRIFQSPDYQVPRFGPARWLPDGTAYTTVEKSPD